MSELGLRAEELASDILGPLLLGGTARAGRPLGPKLSLALGEHRQVVDRDLAAKIDTMRLRNARALVALDVVPPLSPVEWTLLAALNDVIQVTNHELSSFATRGRHLDLCDATFQTVASVPLCATAEQAVSRYATFRRALQLRRVDTTVSWWTGSEKFRGQEAPARLLAWPGLRKVRKTEDTVLLADMADGVPVEPERYDALLNAWLACSPLSDLATAHRARPVFRWSSHTVSLVATVAGSNLALRAISFATNDRPAEADRAATQLAQAAQALPEGAGRNIALQFADWLEKAKHHWAEAS